jgi:hypothetical protein
MLGKLIGYELVKKWKSSKFVLFGFVMIELVLLLIIRMFLWNEGFGEGIVIDSDAVHVNESANAGPAFIILSLLYFILTFFIGAYPFLESIYRFERDLSGKQAYLELMLPAASWKKVFSKLIATVAGLIICGSLSLAAMFTYIMVNSNFKDFMEILRFLIDAITIDNVLNLILLILAMLFAFALFYLIIFFCIAIAKSFTHKNVIAIPIGILAFTLISLITAYIEAKILDVPLYTYTVFGAKFTLSNMLLDIMLFITALIGTSWLMEKRIEH